MTGRYQQRFGHWYNPGPPAKESEGIGLPLTEITMASLLKDAGYATGLVGKWHLGHDPERQPMKRGFDEFFGFLGGSHDYFKAQAGEPTVYAGDDPVDERIPTEALREAKTSSSGTDGIFLYLPECGARPMQAPDKYLERFSEIRGQTTPHARRDGSAMDDAVGNV